MKNLKTFIFLSFISVLSLSITSCSNDTEEQTNKKESSGDHIWKTQTDALQSAKEMAEKMKQSIKHQQQQIDESN